MNIGNGFLVKTKTEALKEIQSACKDDSIKRIPFPVVSDSMEYYMSDKGGVYGCRKHRDFYLVTPLAISKRYKKGPCFKISIGPHKEKEIYLANALYNTFCSDFYDEKLELEFLDGNTYNISLSNLKKKAPCISKGFVVNINDFSDVYRRYFDRAVRFCLWYGGVKMRLDEAKDVASDAFYEMCGCEVKPDLAANLWLHICKNRAMDRNLYMSRFCSLVNDNGEEYLGLNSEYIDTGIWNYVKGERSREYLKWWATGETPTSVAEITHSSPSNVRSSISRTIQYLKSVYRDDIKIFSKSNHYGRYNFEKI